MVKSILDPGNNFLSMGYIVITLLYTGVGSREAGQYKFITTSHLIKNREYLIISVLPFEGVGGLAIKATGFDFPRGICPKICCGTLDFSD